MIKYTFQVGNFTFSILANDDKDALKKAQQAMRESSPVDPGVYLDVELTAGAHEGRLYINPLNIRTKNIIAQDMVQ